MKKILTSISFAFVFTVKSQTIVNTYDLLTPIDSIWSVSSELQGTFAAGNGVFTAVNSGLGLGRKLNEKIEVSELLKFEIESALRYDSEPHLNLLALDFSTVVGIVYSISN